METDIGRVVRDVVELVRPEAESKGLRFSMQLPDGPISMVTDPARLRQIVLILAGNATKYTDAGRVEIRARKEGDDLVIEVTDTGQGIPERRLEYIFQPFSRVDESRTRVTTGTGLGLAIARRLAKLLGGEVRVSSAVGVGSTFWLTLPRQPFVGGQDS